MSDRPRPPLSSVDAGWDDPTRFDAPPAPAAPPARSATSGARPGQEKTDVIDVAAMEALIAARDAARARAAQPEEGATVALHGEQLDDLLEGNAPRGDDGDAGFDTVALGSREIAQILERDESGGFRVGGPPPEPRADELDLDNFEMGPSEPHAPAGPPAARSPAPQPGAAYETSRAEPGSGHGTEDEDTHGDLGTGAFQPGLARTVQQDDDTGGYGGVHGVPSAGSQVFGPGANEPGYEPPHGWNGPEIELDPTLSLSGPATSGAGEALSRGGVERRGAAGGGARVLGLSVATLAIASAVALAAMSVTIGAWLLLRGPGDTVTGAAVPAVEPPPSGVVSTPGPEPGASSLDREVEARQALEVLRAGVEGCVRERIRVLPGTSPPVPTSLQKMRDGVYASSAAEWKTPVWVCTAYKATAPQRFQIQWQQGNPDRKKGTGVVWIDADGDGTADKALGFHATLRKKGDVELGEIVPLPPTHPIAKR